MKKTFIVLSLIFTTIMLTACSRTTLYILNWGAYIDLDLVAEFEQEFGVRVVVDTVESNEIMYTKIKNRTTRYDLAVPSDYMIEKLYNEDLLNELDFSLIPNYQSENIDPGLQALREEYFSGIEKYNVPYFFGTIGIMYNDKPGIKELVEEHEWRVFFDRDLIGRQTKIGMYNSSRDAIAVGALYKGYDLNTNDATELGEIETLLSNMDYDMYETDQLKSRIAQGNLDIALVYLGDFFDELYNTLESDNEITYGLHVPNNNNLWFDSFVIPKTSTLTELAHEFINFMNDVDNATQNAMFVGYCPTSVEVFQNLQDDEEYAFLIENYPYHPIANPETFNGQIYKDLGPEVYRIYEELFQRTKSARR